jgi:hypothetical protein
LEGRAAVVPAESVLRTWGLIRALVFSLGLVFLVAPARADDRSDFEIAEARYKSGNYEEAADRFRALLAKPLDSSVPGYRERVQLHRIARPLFAATLIGLGLEEEADGVILTHLRDDPGYAPTPGQFPAAVSDRFIRVRAANRDELDRIRQGIIKRERQRKVALARYQSEREKWVNTLEELASEETATVTRSRWLAVVPFGVGQFQNGDVGLGVFFAASQTLAIAGTIGFWVAADDLVETHRQGERFNCVSDASNATGQEVLCSDLDDRYSLFRTLNWVSLASAVVLTGAGILEAQLAFEPETVTQKKRQLPPRPKLEVEPSVRGTDGGLMLGVHGRF